MIWLFTWGGRRIGVSASASFLPMNIQGWFPLWFTGLISLLFKGLSRVFSKIPQFKSINFLALNLLYGPTFTSIHDYWKNHSSDYMDLCLCFFNMLSRFFIAFLPRSKHLLISWLQSPSMVILELKKIKSVIASIFSPSICHVVMGRDAMILVFWILNFKPAFSLSFFTFIKRLFSSSSLFSIRLVSSAYLRLLIFLLAILIPACASSSLAFPMMYSAYKLNKQDDHIQPCHTPFPIFSQSIALSNCCFLIRIQVSKEAGKVVRYSHLFKNFPQFVVIHIVKGFSVVKEAEVDVFLELSCFLWAKKCWQFDLWSLCLF